MGLCFAGFRGSVGDARTDYVSFVGVARLGWETFVKCLEFGPIVLNVGHLVGTLSAHI